MYVRTHTHACNHSRCTGAQTATPAHHRDRCVGASGPACTVFKLDSWWINGMTLARAQDCTMHAPPPRDGSEHASVCGLAMENEKSVTVCYSQSSILKVSMMVTIKARLVTVSAAYCQLLFERVLRATPCADSRSLCGAGRAPCRTSRS